MTRLQYPLPTLHEHVTMPYARLASDRWLTFAGWEFKPTGFHQRVSAIYVAFPLSRLTLARPSSTPTIDWLPPDLGKRQRIPNALDCGSI
jgi:hypothetical protein